jgi:hypothetical protein
MKTDKLEERAKRQMIDEHHKVVALNNKDR